MDAQDQHANSRPWLVPFRFKPGTSGNPGGRPREESILRLLRERLASRHVNDEEIPDGRTVAELLCDRLILDALAGDNRLIRELFDRVLGRPRPTEPEAHQGEARDAWQDLADELDAESDGEPRDDPQGTGAVPG